MENLKKNGKLNFMGMALYCVLDCIVLDRYYGLLVIVSFHHGLVFVSCVCSVSYEINLGTSSSVLTLDIEQDGTNDKWSAEFTSQCKRLLCFSLLLLIG